MILNKLEKSLMNSSIRTWFLEHFETNRLLAMGGVMAGGIALDVGCGNGAGSEAIYKFFNAERIDAFDLDPDMVKLAQKRLNPYGNRINVNKGNLTNIKTTANYYDAVFNFTALHHVPYWQEAIREIYRVLKPGGRFYCEEILEKPITSPIGRLLFKHPQENRFGHNKFINVMKENGFLIIESKHIGNIIGFYIADKQNNVKA